MSAKVFPISHTTHWHEKAINITIRQLSSPFGLLNVSFSHLLAYVNDIQATSVRSLCHPNNGLICINIQFIHSEKSIISFRHSFLHFRRAFNRINGTCSNWVRRQKSVSTSLPMCRRNCRLSWKELDECAVNAAWGYYRNVSLETKFGRTEKMFNWN